MKLFNVNIWPETDNESFKEQLSNVKGGKSPNNISPIIKYSCGAKFLWMGDLKTAVSYSSTRKKKKILKISSGLSLGDIFITIKLFGGVVWE